MALKDINPVVVIPVYKELVYWNKSELVSLKQCFSVLGNHTIYLIGPKKLDWISIRTFILQEFGKEIPVGIFDNEYFASIDGYNRILKSLFFYEFFKNYSHLLIYQLDAYLFKDELTYWCSKGFDYIGSPWLKGLTDNTSTTFIGVGNGGFSLRNIQTAIEILKKANTFLPVLKISENTLLFRKLPQLKWITRYILLKLIYKIRNQRYIPYLFIDNKIFEDIFWGKYIPATFDSFSVAGIDDAIKFSFEVNPRFLYKINKEKLPFGCHAWEKYDPEFWSDFIKL